MIELHSFIIHNFKSLHNFKLDFSKFTCLIGLNGAGKSTILQAIDFISQQVNNRKIEDWLTDRNWEAKELKCKLTNEKLITVTVAFYHNKKAYAWSFAFNPSLKKCTYEQIIKLSQTNELIFQVKDSKFILKDLDTGTELKERIFQKSYEGSFLSTVPSNELPKIIGEFKKYIQNIHSLDLLSPLELRKASLVGNTLGLSGTNLSAFIKTFSKEQKELMLTQLKKAYPNVEVFNIKKVESGQVKLELVEKFGDRKLTNEAKYLNDGVLRLIAILAQLQSQKSFLLFDEIENGINSELVEYLMDILVASKHQVMITTHSPMILNYIDDDIAKKSVQYIYKTKEGLTQSIPFFDIPSMNEKLEMMGAGSAYVDTNLEDLIEEIEAVQKSKKEDK